MLINALRVEPELGTPARGGLPATTARRVDDGWSLTGRKIFSTGAAGPALDGRLGPHRRASPARVGSFLVRADSPGITIEPTWDHLGLRASRSDDVIFAGTPVPPGATPAWPSRPLPGPPRRSLAWNALGLTALYLGVAEAARDWLARLPGRADPDQPGPPAGHAAPVPDRRRGDRGRPDRGRRPGDRAGRPGGRR